MRARLNGMGGAWTLVGDLYCCVGSKKKMLEERDELEGMDMELEKAIPRDVAQSEM